MITDFLERCSGIVLLTEVDEDAGEKEYDKKIRIEKRERAVQNLYVFWLPAVMIIAGIMAFMQAGTGAIFPFIFLLLTLAGSIASFLLLWYELDQYNPLLQQICSAGKKVNCGAILNSKASKIAGISWSTIGFSYFMGNLLLLLFWGITSPQALFASAWLNLIAVPYVFYSVYYQWRVARQWCVLCLFVQGLLVLQFATALATSWYILLPFSVITPQWFVQAVAAYGIPFMVVGFLFPALRNAKEKNRINTELQQLKHNPQIFEALLAKQKAVTENPESLGITLGNPNAIYKIIKVCNPYCGPCAKAHVPMEELLHNNPDVQIQITVYGVK